MPVQSSVFPNRASKVQSLQHLLLVNNLNFQSLENLRSDITKQLQDKRIHRPSHTEVIPPFMDQEFITFTTKSSIPSPFSQENYQLASKSYAMPQIDGLAVSVLSDRFPKHSEGSKDLQGVALMKFRRPPNLESCS